MLELKVCSLKQCILPLLVALPLNIGAGRHFYGFVNTAWAAGQLLGIFLRVSPKALALLQHRLANKHSVF